MCLSHLSSRPVWTCPYGKGRGTRTSKLNFWSTLQASTCVTFANIPFAKTNCTLANPRVWARGNYKVAGQEVWRGEELRPLIKSIHHIFFVCILHSHINSISGGKEARCECSVHQFEPEAFMIFQSHAVTLLFPETGMTLSLPSSINILTIFQNPNQTPSFCGSLL